MAIQTAEAQVPHRDFTTGIHGVGAGYVAFAGAAGVRIVRTATFVVASSGALADSKGSADRLCSGENDEVDIQALIDALPT